jgi:ribosome biogenesis GTPase
MQPVSAAYAHRQGIVYKKTIGNYVVHIQETQQVVTCEISPRLHKQLIYPTADPNSLRHVVREVKEIRVSDPVAVGDQVQFVDTGSGAGLITEVLPRKSKLVRRSAVPMPGAHPFEQIIVANVDQVVPVFSAAQPPPKWNLLDRYLTSAESLDLSSLICITKLDLAERDSRLQAELELYRQIGYRVLLTSTVTGEGLAELHAALQGRISVFVGKSGVGKTSLLNALQPGLGLRVNAVNQVTGKGKHTTTNLEMFPLENGGSVVDTPGMREFGLWEIDESDLALLFPEMRAYVGRCKFGLDCSHDHEPGCAIRKAVAEGKIAPRRYATFQRLRQE